jgi:hypothetical protein
VVEGVGDEEQQQQAEDGDLKKEAPAMCEGSGDVGERVVDCVCGADDDDGERMACCDICEAWQHTRCAGVADAEDVEAVGDEFLFDRGRVGERGKADAGVKVGEEAEMFAQRKERAALGLDVGWQGFPFWSTDGAEENRVRGLAGGDGFRRKRVSGGIDGCSADEVLCAGDGESEFRLNGVEKAEGFGHDFGADAVSGEDRDAVAA